MKRNWLSRAPQLLLVLSLIGVAPPALLGQVDRGGIVGTVTDSSGAVVPSATVSVTNVGTGAVTRLTTDASGEYTATLLPIGTYTVTAEKEGFQRTVQPDVVVGIGLVVRTDLVLQVGAVTQELRVTAAPPLVQRDTSALGTIESERRIVDLPLNGRNFFQLAYLGPGANQGATGTSAGVGSTDNNRPGIAVSVNGLRIFDNNFILDGVDNNEFGNGTIIVQPPPDAIQEFRVEENSMNAEFGRGGAAVNLVLKSGTNDVHGGAYEFLRNDHLDARNFFDDKRAPLQRNQYGGYGGGPIKKDRMFFFADIARTNIRQGQTYINTVPTVKMRGGDFSELGTPIFDPYTTNPLTGTRQLINPDPLAPDLIPSGRIDTVGQNIANLYPLPNRPGVANNYLASPKQFFDQTSFDTRYDDRISDRDQLFVHYSLANVNSDFPSFLGSVAGGASSGVSSSLGQRLQSTAAGWTHAATSTFINDLHGGYFRFRDVTLPLDFGQTPALTLGIPNANRGDSNTSGLTKIQIAGFQDLGDSLWVPETIVENIFQLADTVSWVRGKHQLKFGADFRRQQRNFFQQTASKGRYQFSGVYTNDPATGVGGNGLADTLLGVPSFSFVDKLAGEYPTRYWDLAEFVQDTVRMTPNLTLNLGLRYEVNSPAGGRVGNFDLQRAIVVPGSGPGSVPHGGVGFDKKDFGPRLGFAWSPPFAGRNTVVRGGFGVFYAPEGNIFDDLGLNPPNLLVFSQNFSSLSIPTPGQLVDAGFPAVFAPVDLSHPTGTVRSGGDVRRIPYIMEWNFNIQREIRQDWVLQVAYVGARALRLFDHEAGNFNQPLLPLDTNFSDATGNMGRPYFSQLPGLTTILPLDIGRFSMANHGLEVSLNKRFSNGFNILAAYTLAKSLGTADGNVNQCDIQNAHDVAAEKGPATPDFRHRFTVSYLYELPYGRQRRFGSQAGKAADLILGGWQVGGITTLQSGEAYNALLSSDRTNTGAASARPDRIHNPTDFSFNVAQQTALGCSNPGHQTLDCFFNQGAFLPSPLAPGQSSAHQFGNAGRAVLRGPNEANLDFSLSKKFRLTERQGLEFRAEFFNIFNNPQFGLPHTGSGGGSSGAGFIDVPGGAAITQTLPNNQREIQFALKYSF